MDLFSISAFDVHDFIFEQIILVFNLLELIFLVHLSFFIIYFFGGRLVIFGLVFDVMETLFMFFVGTTV